MVCIFASLSTTRISGELFSLLLCYLLKVPRLRPPSLSFQPTEGACCLSVLLSKKARAEESFLPRPVAPSFARPPMQPLYSLLTVGPKSVFLLAFVCAAVFLSPVLHSAVTRVTHPLILSVRMIHLQCDEKVGSRIWMGVSSSGCP